MRSTSSATRSKSRTYAMTSGSCAIGVRMMGKGIDPRFPIEEGARDTNGLHGCSSHAKLMGGKLNRLECVDSGAEVELRSAARITRTLPQRVFPVLRNSPPGKACLASHEQHAGPIPDSVGR